MRKLTCRAGLLLLSIMVLIQSVCAAELIPGGQIIGLELQDGSVSIARFDDTLGKEAINAGLQVGDRIVKINNKPVTCPEDIRQALTQANGTVDICVKRDQQEKTLRLDPRITTDGPRLGVYLKQGITGVGTVTWYDPETGDYGALGHGVSNPDKTLIQMEKGTAYQAGVQQVKKGISGEPGQLMGQLKGETPIGTIGKNTPQGIFGTLSVPVNGEPIPLGDAGSVHTGSAVIRSTVRGNDVQEYSVEILKIYPVSKGGGRNMLLKVTDQNLLSATGGIVQGMSGSPIIQDGKLIGAVTHVLVDDPTTGYGIFIENMLDAAA